jgi:protein involved in polysaccharide export with SLBB domain
MLPLFGGCTSGSSGGLFPHTYKLLPRAKEITASARRFAPIPRELEKQAIQPYYVQPGDVLLIEVTDLEANLQLPADQTVMPDGTIDLGQYGRITVAGLTIEQIEALVLDAVKAVVKKSDVKPINVRLNVAESGVYYVLGEVNSPGSYPLIGRETVLDGLMAAGGISDRASECKIILSRPTSPPSCRVVLPVCYDRIVQLGDSTTNYQLQPGDRIYVASRTLCESLMFWRSDCANCPDCGDAGCRDPIVPRSSPFVVDESQIVTPPEEILAPLPQ